MKDLLTTTPKMLALAVGLLLLAGCRGPEPREGFWRPNGTEQEFAQDYYACSQRPPTEWCVGNNPYYRWFVGSGG